MRLTDALSLGPREIVTFVGGGGKTTSMYLLARECARAGGRALATGTTLFTPPPARARLPLVMLEEGTVAEDALAGPLAREGCAIVASGHGSKGRLLPLEPAMPARLLDLLGLDGVFVEGDGSRGRAFKAPAEHEPVIADGSTLVVVVAGLSVLGQPLDDEHVHRADRVAALTGAQRDAPVTDEIMAQVLAHPLGGRKHVAGGCRFAVLLNQAEPRRLVAARALARRLLDAGVPLVVLARVQEDAPVVEVVDQERRSPRRA